MSDSFNEIERRRTKSARQARWRKRVANHIVMLLVPFDVEAANKLARYRPESATMTDRAALGVEVAKLVKALP
jgi:hypothetical protein